MATTDANGQVFYGPTDPVEPLQALFNGVSTAVSTKMSSETQVVRIANVAGRTAAVAARTTAGRAITAADPLIVWRTDAPDGSQLEQTGNGSAWRPVAQGNVQSTVAGAKILGGNQPYTTNGNGDASITLPAGYFTTSLISVQLTDSLGNLAPGSITFRWNAGASHAGFIAFRAIGTGGALPNYSGGVSWLALGS